jgi:hypothetical protein
MQLKDKGFFVRQELRSQAVEIRDSLMLKKDQADALFNKS